MSEANGILALANWHAEAWKKIRCDISTLGSVLYYQYVP